MYLVYIIRYPLCLLIRGQFILLFQGTMVVLKVKRHQQSFIFLFFPFHFWNTPCKNRTKTFILHPVSSSSVISTSFFRSIVFLFYLLIFICSTPLFTSKVTFFFLLDHNPKFSFQLKPDGWLQKKISKSANTFSQSTCKNKKLKTIKKHVFEHNIIYIA